VIIILFIIVALFNAIRPLLVILLTIPFAVIGITLGLLTFDVPFGFVALLGAMSLVGMMIKNAIVLLDEVNINLAERGMTRYDAVIHAALSRLNPVVLAAATTVLGVIPLLKDAFWIGLAVTVMAGLTFGTILTMILVPTLYATLYRLRADQTKEVIGAA
jgi:multidrug efflux pump subunit AcrB